MTLIILTFKSINIMNKIENKFLLFDLIYKHPTIKIIKMLILLDKIFTECCEILGIY